MRRRPLLAFAGGAALAPLVARDAAAGPGDGCSLPVATNDGWRVAPSDGDSGIDRAALCRMADRLAVPGAAAIHSVLVVRGGALAFERYFQGDDEVPGWFVRRRPQRVSFDAGTLHDVKSVSKSVASLAVGIAIDQGFIRSVDAPVFSFFPDLADLRSPEKDRIKLSDVLQMSMGLAWVEATPATGDLDNDETRMRLSGDPCRYVLGRPVTAPAGRAFFYNTGALALVAAIIRRTTGRPLDEFAQAVLFEKLGIAGATWDRVRGETDAGGGLRLRPRDMAKIGQLVLAQGRWNGRQVVSNAWVAASTASGIKASDGMSYGYLWWTGQTRLAGRAIGWVGALGRGGQSIRIVPELDLVVVVTAGYYQDDSQHAFRVQYGVFRDVLRAVAPPG